jgi:hypothetical protein
MFYSAILAQPAPSLTTSFLILGYVVLTLIAVIYVVSLVNRQRNLKRDLEVMRRLLEEDE